MNVQKWFPKIVWLIIIVAFWGGINMFFHMYASPSDGDHSSYSHSVPEKHYSVETIPNVHLQDRFNYVSNPDGILLEEDVWQINQLLKDLEDSTTIEVAVVAVESIGDNDSRMLAFELFNYWGVGKKDADNGLLILLVTEPVQRSVVFETGYGLEGILPDAICYRLQQTYMIPDMKESAYSKGMVKGVEAVINYIYANGDLDFVDSGYTNAGDDWWVIGIILSMTLLPFMIIFLVIIMASIRKRRKKVCPKCQQKEYKYIRTTTIKRATYTHGGVVEETYTCKNCRYTQKIKRKTPKKTHSSSSSSGGGGSSSSSGSWGGGSSGGGGARSSF